MLPPSRGRRAARAALCACTFGRLARSLTSDPKPVLPPRANVTHRPGAGLEVHEELGHISWRRWGFVVPIAAFEDLGIPTTTRLIHNHKDIIMYVVLPNESGEVWSSFDPPDIFQQDDISGDFALIKDYAFESGPAPTVLDALGRRALQYRTGTHFYSRCAHNGPYTWWPTNIHLTSALEPLFEGRAQHLYVVNFGAANLSPTDPLGSFFHDAWLVDGVSFDADKKGLLASRRVAWGHPMRWIQATVSPGNAMEHLRRYNVSGRAVDILKVDIDSHDMAVLEAVIPHVEPAVVVAEWLLQVPPPWEFIYLGSRADEGGVARFMGGVSLSALVKRMLRRGYFLYKLSYVDAVFVRYSVADVFVQAEKKKGVDLLFPIDEWACYFTVPVYHYAHGTRRHERPLGGWFGENVREWMASPLEVAEARMRSNLSYLYGDDWDYILRTSEPNVFLDGSHALAMH